MLKSNRAKVLSGTSIKPLNQVVLLPLSMLRSNPRNVRTHPKKQVQQLANSIKRFGFTNPILVDRDHVIIAGAGRAEAAKLIGMKAVPVLYLDDLTEAEKRAYVLADNKLAQNAGWDRSLLAEELGNLAPLLLEEGIDLDGHLGFAPGEYDALMVDSEEKTQTPDEDLPPRPSRPTTHLGDIWTLDDHRIICGDARDADTYGRLLRDEQAAMVFADPPYNVRIDGHVGGRGRTKHREFSVASGELSRAQFTEFLQQALALCAQNSTDGSIHYVCMDWRHARELITAGNAVFSELKNVCVWVKSNAGQGSFYRSQHELVFVFKNGDAEHLNTFKLGQHGRTRTNVWNYQGANTFRVGRMTDLEMHPTVKPTALVADAMRDCSKRGSIILDPFLGSGTSIIAAEQIGRRGYGVELDPAYVDVSIQRWQNLTKRDAVLEGTKWTFDELRADSRLRTKAPATRPRGSHKALR